jgi:hypothetical protein
MELKLPERNAYTGPHKIKLVAGETPPIHPDYYRLNNEFGFYGLSYEGGSRYKSGTDSEGNKTFIEHEHESPQGILRRKSMSTYRNYCRLVVDKFNSFVFEGTITRDEEDKRFDTWEEDVDGKGTCLAKFSRIAATHAAIFGRWLTIVNTTKDPMQETEAQTMAGGANVVLEHKHPSCIIDWEDCEWNDKLLMRAYPEGYQFGAVLLIDKETITTCPLDKDGKIISIGPPESHGWDGMPVIVWYGLNRTLTPSASLIGDISELNKRIFNLDSVLAEELYKQTFTQYFAIGVSADDFGNGTASPGSRKIICINKPQTEVRFEKITSDPAQADSIRSSLTQDSDEIYRLVGLRKPDVSIGPESGRALKIRFVETSAIAASLSSNAEESENKIISLWNAAMSGNAEESEYPDSEDFDEESLVEELKSTLDLLGGNFPEMMKAEKVKKYAAREFCDLDGEKQVEMQQEIEDFYKPELVPPITPILPLAAPMDKPMDNGPKQETKNPFVPE